MKQLSALGARRHAFFRSPRRMRTLVDRLEPGELIPNGPFSYYGGKSDDDDDDDDDMLIRVSAGLSVSRVCLKCRIILHVSAKRCFHLSRCPRMPLMNIMPYLMSSQTLLKCNNRTDLNVYTLTLSS